MSVSALRHTAFLNRLDDDNLSGTGSRRGQAAFLALRVVDLLAGPWQENAQAFEYQRSATERYLTELADQEHPETTLLRRILQVGTGTGPREPLLLCLRDYAEFLAVVGALAESADVLATLLELGIGYAPPPGWIEAFHRNVRTLIALDRTDEAAELEMHARAALRGVTDPAVRLRARVVRVELMIAQGDLDAADRAARRCLIDAQRTGEVELAWTATAAIARALVKAHSRMGASAVLEHLSSGERRAPSVSAQLDLAEALLELGDLAASSDALQSAFEGGLADIPRLRAQRLALEVSARTGDELGFARGFREVGRLLHPALIARLRGLIDE